MNTTRQIINELLDEVSDEMINNIISYIIFIKNEKKNNP